MEERKRSGHVRLVQMPRSLFSTYVPVTFEALVNTNLGVNVRVIPVYPMDLGCS